MHGMTADGIALFAGMIFLAAFIAVAVWLLRR
jgi:flagellar biogenesis protein FliO